MEEQQCTDFNLVELNWDELVTSGKQSNKKLQHICGDFYCVFRLVTLRLR